jgi:hypothetical protein
VTTRHHLVVALVVVVAAATFRLEPLPLGPPGIDPGWQWTINQAAQQGWVHGRDLVFTYGPLGWIASPQDTWGHLGLAAAFEMLLQLLMAAIAIDRLRREPEAAATIVTFAVLWLAAAGLGLRFEGRVVLTVAALCLFGLWRERPAPLVIAAVLGGLAVFIKVSLGVAVMATLAAALAVDVRRRGWRRLTGPVGAAVVVFAVGAATTIGPPGAVLAWLRYSADLVSGYAVAGSIVGSTTALLSGLAILVGLAGLAEIARRGSLGWLVLVLAPGLLIHFRLAFVRQDGHQFLFLPFAVGMLAVAALGLPAGRLWRWPAAAATAATVVAVLGGATPWGLDRLPSAIARSVPGPMSMARLAHPQATTARLARQSAHNLEPLAIPDDWVRRIRASGDPVAVIPWEAMYAPANGLSSVPLRTVQLYAAFSRGLDDWSAGLFEGDTAPGWVLDDFAPVGKRRALLDAPATWRAIHRAYDVDSVRWDPFLMLLRRREAPLDQPLREVGTTRFETAGPGLRVPTTAGAMVFASLDLPLNLVGRLNRSLFRVPLVLCVFHHVDGTQSRGRLIPATAGAGILVDPFPHAVDDYVGLWTGRPAPPVVRFQLQGPGLRYHAPVASVQWLELPAMRSGARGERTPNASN